MKRKIIILNSPPKFLVYAILRAIAHPRTPITYRYCSSCRLRFNINENECPKCHDKVGQSPDNREMSPIPWYCSVIVIGIGVGTGIASAILSIIWLQEVSRALVYIPLGSLFGMSIKTDVFHLKR